MANSLGLQQKIRGPTHKHGKTLDLIFTDNEDARAKVLTNAEIADHQPIMMEIQDNLEINEGPLRKMWKYRSADWRGLKRYIKSRVSLRKLRTLNLEASVDHMDQAIKKGMDRYIPSVTEKIRTSSVPWFDDECYQKMKSAQDDTRYKEEYLNTIERKRLEHKAMIRRRIRGQNISERSFWKHARTLQGNETDRNSRIPPMKSNGEIITDSHMKCKRFAEAFIAKASLPDGGQYIPRPGGPYSSIRPFKFTIEEVHKWLRASNPNKAAGPNSISPRVYKHLASVLAHPLHIIFSRMLKLGKWPRQWRLSAVCPIFKKKDPSIFTNYRPISLIDVPSKTFETRIARHLTEGITKNGFLPDEQYGFRPRHSSSDLAYTIIGTAMTSNNARQPLHLLQTDIAAAFDRVDRSILLKRLKETGIDNHMLKLLASYLSERTFNVRINGQESNDHQMDTGVVQGSGLGPFMWNVYFAGVFDTTGPLGIGFADDLNLLSTDRQEIELIKARVMAFCTDNRITMEPAKETLTTFYPPRHPLKEEQKTTRLVGIQLDEDLNMEDHIKNNISKAHIARRRLLRMKPYCTTQQLTSLYKTLIWSSLEVGSVCYSHASATRLQKIDRFENASLRMLGITRTGIDSLSLRRKLAHSAMIYKQVVLEEGPNYLRRTFPLKPPDARAHLRRQSTIVHPYQLTIPQTRTTLAKFSAFCGPLFDYNRIPIEILPPEPNLAKFKSDLSTYYRHSLM